MWYYKVYIRLELKEEWLIFILTTIIELYVIVTILALLTSLAKFLATSKEERDFRRKVAKKILEQAKKASDMRQDNAAGVMKKIVEIRINGFKNDNKVKLFLFNVAIHFIPVLNFIILIGNINDVIVTFKN